MFDDFPTKIGIHWTKYIYCCGLIMYCTSVVHKQTQLRKSLKYSTPGIPPRLIY